MKFLKGFAFLVLFFNLNFGIAQARPVFTCHSIFSNVYTLPKYQDKAFEIIMSGSANVSRTKALGKTFFAYELNVPNVSGLAEKNFERAARFVLENHMYLDINLKTAKILNKILTKGLTPDSYQGNFEFRKQGSNRHFMDDFMEKSPQGFYVDWLNSAHAKELFENNPVTLADIIHHSVAALDSFPDGNGRLSRLMADLVLIKKGLGPAYYTSMEDYFARGNSRAQVGRMVISEYYREITARGAQELLKAE